MPGSTIGTILNYGYPGGFARNGDCIIASRLVKSTDAVGPSFGDPVVLNGDNTYSRFGASNTATQFAGVAVREVHQASDYYPSNGVYSPGQPCDVIERGSVSVVCTEGTPAAGGSVYIVTVAGSGAVSAVGNLIANATPAGTGSTAIQLANAKWATGQIDANNVAELTILTRNNP